MSDDGNLADWIREWRLAGCNCNPLVDGQACSPCIRDRILASEWLAQVKAAAHREAARRMLDHEDEWTVDEAAGLWMAGVHGGDTGEDADWHEAYAEATRIGRPDKARYDVWAERIKATARAEALEEAALTVRALGSERCAKAVRSLDAPEEPRCQHVSPSPWGPTQCALPLDHEGRHAYSPSESIKGPA